MKQTPNKLLKRFEQVSPIRVKILQACEYIERAVRSTRRENNLGIDFAYVDASLAKAISLLASARAICITEGNLADPAFDDGDVWDWDEEVGLPDDAAAGDGEGVSP